MLRRLFIFIPEKDQAHIGRIPESRQFYCTPSCRSDGDSQSLSLDGEAMKGLAINSDIQ
jgi:hypothetical protein